MYPLWEPLLTYQFQLNILLFTSFWKWVHPKSFDLPVFNENRILELPKKSASWSLWFVKYVKDIRNTMAPNKVLAKPTSTCLAGGFYGGWFSPGTVFLCVFCCFFGGKEMATSNNALNTQKPPGDFVFETVLKEQIPISMTIKTLQKILEHQHQSFWRCSQCKRVIFY